MPDELSPCPFCAGKAQAHRFVHSAYEGGVNEWVACDECGATRPTAEEWNRRTPASHWISVKDLLPLEYQTVDVWHSRRGRYTEIVCIPCAKRDRVDWMMRDSNTPVGVRGEITHWMPTPSPPPSQSEEPKKEGEKKGGAKWNG